MEKITEHFQMSYSYNCYSIFYSKSIRQFKILSGYHATKQLYALESTTEERFLGVRKN